jgi:hypothetical protein
MAMPPKEENLRNPLRVLREQLSGTTLLTQKDLEKIIKVPVNTIKAIEAGQRPMTWDTEEAVGWQIGSLWDAQAKQWMYEGAEKRIPLTWDILVEWRRLSSQRPSAEKEAYYRIHFDAALNELFRTVPDSRWWELWFRCQQFLADCRSKFASKPTSPPPKRKKRP